MKKFVNEVQKNLFTINDVRLTAKTAQYAVRGRVPNRALEINQELKRMQETGGATQYPFDSLTEANIGNPQTFGQPPISFNREVLAGTLYPELVSSGSISNKDVVERIEKYRAGIVGNVGAYSESLGYRFGRQAVSDFIKRRDGLTEGPDLNNLYLVNGASEGVTLVISALTQNPTDGIMIPIPQYPLYSAQIALQGGSQINYFLNESDKWSISVEELKKQYALAKGRGVTPRLLCVINPGNPTGTVLQRDNIEAMIKFAYENNMAIIADEVYQENVYVPGQKFISFKKVLSELPAPYNKCEIAHLHSTSKGIIGECGLRGGFMELSNFDAEVQGQITKLKSINLCANTIGQLTTELMTNHPRENAGFSDETLGKYNEETSALFSGLQERSAIITEALNGMTNIETQPAEAAMYAFPQIYFSEKAIQAAREQGMEPDLFYCLQVLENTGIVLVPGSGFGQREGTYHFRTTNLIRPESRMREKMQVLSKFNDSFHAQYK